MQRGTLQHLLAAISLILQLADRTAKSNVVNSVDTKTSVEPKEGMGSCPLVPFLRRISGVATPVLPQTGPVHVSIMAVPELSSPSCLYHQKRAHQVVNPTKSFLDYLSLPNDDSSQLGLRHIAAVALSHLDRIAEPYNSRGEVCGLCVVCLGCVCLQIG